MCDKVDRSHTVTHHALSQDMLWNHWTPQVSKEGFPETEDTDEREKHNKLWQKEIMDSGTLLSF